MNGRRLLSIGLLLFLGASVTYLIVREVVRETPATGTPEGEDPASLPKDGLVAYYFHGQTRCPTCVNIENHTRTALESGFSEQLASGEIQWRVVNYETPAAEHFVEAYEIVAPTVVLVRLVDGKVANWRSLARVWELVGDRPTFIEYVQNETRSMLGS